MNEKKAASKITLNGSDYMNREVQTRIAFRVYPNDKKEMNKLRKKSGLVWPTFAKYVNRLVKEDLNRKVASELNKFNKEEN
ncbi:hypothetical protein A3SAC12_0034 [Lactobacillus phage 3-SAC12]|nr:hypothetical protein A3SAC12_0034 [Lactobacillus phage 3-SAC12]